MNEKLSPFQIIIFGILIISIVGGVIVFSLQRGANTEAKIPIDIWGTIPAETINSFQNTLNQQVPDSLSLVYKEFSEQEFEGALIEALAAGTGPDAVILSDEMILKHENKLFLIGYEFYPQKQFKDNFIEAGEVLLRENGFLGFPILIDPLVMYWNRTILNNEGITAPPKYWDDFLTLVPRLVQKDSVANVSRAAVAFGAFDNIKNAKYILISLIQQAGNDIILRDADRQAYYSALIEKFGFTLRPADTAVNFFVQFSNPSKNVYSWNGALPNSNDMFLSGDLAFYFGFASERAEILQKNPNLNFDVAVLPQSRSSDKNTTVGQMHFVAIINKSPKISNSYTTLVKMTDKTSVELLTNLTKSASVRRDVGTDVNASAHLDVFNKSALISRVFVDPNEIETGQIFKKMIESVIVGDARVATAVDRAGAELTELLK